MMLDWDEFYRSGRHRQAWELNEPSPELAAYLAAHPARPGQAALDIGCGTGQDAVALAAAGWRAVGVDVSVEALALARRRSAQYGVQVDWHQADATNLPFAPAVFQLVVDRGCFHHVPDGQRAAYAQEAARVLAVDGVLLLRGCRARRLPFVPLTAEAVRRYFTARLFHLDSIAEIDLQAGTGTLPGLLCRLVRRNDS